VKGRATVILDIGASNVNTAEDLYGFAKMGSLYASEILDLKNPSVYVLSNGTEEGKGTEEVVKAYELLKERNFPGFEGNVEARDALDGKHDVIVTSGFTGNVFLKAVEGTASMMNGMIKDAFKTSFGTKIGYLFAKKGFKEMKTRMDYRKYGGAILLGVNGVAVKAHGNSNAYAFYHAIDVAEKMAEKNIVNRIREAFHD
jgi:glycerol-3-phosphate acyltransferase PlsX